VTDLRRLGKPGSYRLGRLRVQGSAPPGPPPPLRPRFRRPRHQGPTALWLLAAAAGAALIAAGAAAGLWFLPLAAGVAAGLANRFGGWRARVLVPVVAAMAMAGWGMALGWPALHGHPAGGTAPVIAGLARRTSSATASVLVALLIAALLALAGLWLGHALAQYPRAAVADAGIAEAAAAGAAADGAADEGAAEVRTLDPGAMTASTVAASGADHRMADVGLPEIQSTGIAPDPRAGGKPERGSGGRGDPAGPTIGE
jgi:hypothetical protein